MAQVYLSQYSKRAALADLALTASFAASASQVNPIRLDPVQDPNPTGLLYTSSTYLYQSASNTALGYDMYIRQDGNVVKWKWVEGMLNTGILYGGVLSYSASSFLVTPGAGIIVDHNATSSSEINPMINYVTWGPITQSIENIATYQNTFVYIDVSGSASQQNVFFAPEQYHFYIPLGRISHYDNVVTNGSNMNVQTAYDIDRQQNVFVRAFGPLKLKGIATSGQPNTLRLNIGSGTAFNLGGYYDNDPNEPSIYNMSTYNTASIIRIYRDGTGDYVFDNDSGNYYTTIDPGNYDDGTGTLASVGNNDWTIQRVMVNPVTGRAHVYYGQNVYDTFEEAIADITADEFVESDATAFAYPFSAYLILKGDTTDLTDDTENKIVQAGLFRNIGGGGGTGGGGIPGGQDTQIQFNNAGVFDGEPEFTFNPTTNIVTLTGSMIASGAVSASFGPNTVGFFGTASWAQSASNALTSSRAFSASYASASSFAISASFASTASIAVSSSYASSSPNFANTNLVFTDNRRHDTDRYSFFLYSDLVGGNETDPFDGFGVSGSFYYFDNDSNSLGTAAGSTNTYTYIEIISESIDLSFNADPASPSAYSFTNQHAYFSSSLTVTNSVYFPNLTSASRPNVVMIDTTSGQLYYLDSSSLGGTSVSLDIQDDGILVLSNPTILNFTGSGVSASADGTTVDIYIPGGGIGTPGGDNTQIQFNGEGGFSGSANFTFLSASSTVILTGSLNTSGSITLTGSMFVSGAISASLAPNTVGFYGTASWAQSASNALTSSRAFSASYASASSFAISASFAANVTAAPSDTYIQYNSASVFGAEQYFRYIYDSHSLEQGNNVTASGQYSHAQGYKSEVYGIYSHAEGNNTYVGTNKAYSASFTSNTGSLLSSYGNKTSAFTVGAYILWYNGSFKGSALIESKSYNGSITQVFVDDIPNDEYFILPLNAGFGAHSATGDQIIPVSGAHAEGEQSEAFGDYSSAIGNGIAVGYGSQAIGGGLTIGDYSQAVGDAYAIGFYSRAEGNRSRAIGNYSHAEGVQTRAQGLGSHTEGFKTLVEDNYSHAEGFFTTASGQYSHAEGSGSIALGWYSHAEGRNTITSGSYQLAIGQFNVANDSQSAFIIGDGTADNDRHNLLFASQSWFEVSASNVFLQGLPSSSETHVLMYNTSSGQVYYTASSAIGGEFTPYPIDITGSTLYSVDPPAFVSGVPANANNSIFFGLDAGQSAGQFGGTASYVVGIGVGAGQQAGFGNINYSNFIGYIPGYVSLYASQSNFIGYQAGFNSQNAHNSNFIGYNAGLEQDYFNINGGAYSNYIGYQAGVGYLDFNLGSNVGPGYNNTIIGTSISLPNGTSNYVNIGGAFFISGTYFNNAPHPIISNYSSNILTESINTAKVGINLWNPSYNFHVSGTVGFPNLTDSNTATKVVLVDNNGQLFTTASNAVGGGGGSGTPTPPSSPLNSIQFNSSSAFGGQDTFTFLSASSEVYLTGSILVLGTSSINGISLIGTSSAQALYTTAKITTIAGLNTIYSLQTASYDGAFFEYTLISASNARAGQIMSIWSGSQIRYTETTTTDIGSTSEFIFSVALTAGSASLQVTGSADAIIKTIIKSI